MAGTAGDYDAIVIGSGMGGMACAGALARCGWRVLVLEQHYVAGGMTHTFRRRNMTWDVGLHAVGDMDPRRLPGQLLRWLTDGRVDMHKYGDVYDVFHLPDGTCYELPADEGRYRERLLTWFPSDRQAILTYLDLVNQAAGAATGHFLGRLLPPALEAVLAPLLRRRFDRWAGQTTAQVLDSLAASPALRSHLAGQWGYYGLPPSRASFYIHAATIRHFLDGGYYPAGGSGVLAEELLRPVAAKGGQVRLRTAVETLLVEGGRAAGVVTAGGEVIRARAVVSAIGARATVERLLPPPLAEAGWAREIRALEQSPSHVALYLGFAGDIAAAGARAANQWFYETGDPEQAAWRVEDPAALAPGLYVSFPSLKDPRHDPSTPHTGEAVTLVPWEAFACWQDSAPGRRGGDYEAFKAELERRLLDQLFARLPGLRRHLVYHELSTPLSTAHYCRAPQGAIYGLASTPQRFACAALRPRTPIPGFYLAGADVATLGVAGAMVGGLFAAIQLAPRLGRLLLPGLAA